MINKSWNATQLKTLKIVEVKISRNCFPRSWKRAKGGEKEQVRSVEEWVNEGKRDDVPTTMFERLYVGKKECTLETV